MAEKKKPKGGAHKSPRRPVQLPRDWLLVAEQLARQARQPTMWFLVSLIEEKARQASIPNLPPGPWDEKPADGTGPAPEKKP